MHQIKCFLNNEPLFPVAFLCSDDVGLFALRKGGILCVEIICIYEENKICYEFDCGVGDSDVALAGKL